MSETTLDPDAKAYIDESIKPFLLQFGKDMAQKRAGGFDDEDIEGFVRDAVESFEEHRGQKLDPVYGPYVVAKMREAAGLPSVAP